MEKMVNYRLVHELLKEKRLPTEQYGFRRGRSTEDVHVILETEAQEAFREKQHLILVSLDLEKAYEKMTIANGVVQGAVLSVTLFLIAISEMANKTKEPHTERRNKTILSQRLDEEEMRT
jgi:hypothetical protein